MTVGINVGCAGAQLVKVVFFSSEMTEQDGLNQHQGLVIILTMQ